MILQVRRTLNVPIIEQLAAEKFESGYRPLYAASMARRLGLVLGVVLILAPRASVAQGADPDEFPGADFFYDAGAIGFVYAPLAVWAAAELAFDPPAEPRLFPRSEGGETLEGNTVPEIYLGIGGAALAAALFSPDRDGQWFHLQGFAQATATTLAVSGIAKLIFGRHRPFYLEGSPDSDHRKSFPSSHSSSSFVMASYGCMYLHRDGELGAIRTSSCAALLATASLIAYSRVRDNRHHPSDLIAGAVLGTAIATGFFVWHERRYRGATDDVLEASPWVGSGGRSLVLGFSGLF